MKNLFSVAILAAAFTFASCGNKPADSANTAAATTTSATTTATPTPAADNSLSGRGVLAVCNCPAFKEIAALEKEKNSSKDNPDKLQELSNKIMELSTKSQECTKVIMEELIKLSEEDKMKFETEMQEKLAKTCPDLMPKK
jgi:hypothetical protein